MSTAAGNGTRLGCVVANGIDWYRGMLMDEPLLLDDVEEEESLQSRLVVADTRRRFGTVGGTM